MCDFWRKTFPHEGTYVKVTTLDNKTHDGFLYASDPETGNIVLLSPGPKLALITRQHVQSVQPGGAMPEQMPTQLPTLREEGGRVISEACVLEGLRKRRIVATVQPGADGNVRCISLFDGAAYLSSPYSSSSCRSRNEVVLVRVRKLLDEIYDETCAKNALQDDEGNA